MTARDFAQDRLKRELVGYREHGLNFWIKHIASTVEGLEGMEDKTSHGFIPAGTRLRRQPAYNPQLEPWDFTLELWDIEGPSGPSGERLRAIEMFANDLFDLSHVFTELWVCDSYGTNRRKVYDVREDIDGGAPMPDAHPHEWLSEGTWRQSECLPRT